NENVSKCSPVKLPDLFCLSGRCDELQGAALRRHTFRENRMHKRDNQVTVPLPPELRSFVRDMAAREDRSEAGLIRHLVAEAQRRLQNQQGQATLSRTTPPTPRCRPHFPRAQALTDSAPSLRPL